jgi:hypothetical protein
VGFLAKENFPRDRVIGPALGQSENFLVCDAKVIATRIGGTRTLGTSSPNKVFNLRALVGLLKGFSWHCVKRWIFSNNNRVNLKQGKQRVVLRGNWNRSGTKSGLFSMPPSCFEQVKSFWELGNAIEVAREARRASGMLRETCKSTRRWLMLLTCAL